MHESVNSVIGWLEWREFRAKLRPSLMAKSSAERMVVVGCSFQLVVMFSEGRYMAALVDGVEGMCEPSVKI